MQSEPKKSFFRQVFSLSVDLTFSQGGVVGGNNGRGSWESEWWIRRVSECELGEEVGKQGGRIRSKEKQ